MRKQLSNLAIHLFGLLLVAAPLQVLHAANDDPVSMLESATEKLLSELRSEREAVRNHPERLLEMAEELLVPKFDVRGMARWVLGPHWKRASKDQQSRFSAEFKDLVVRFYVAALISKPERIDEILDMEGDLITYHPLNGKIEKRVQVQSTVNLPSGTTVPVNFRLYFSKKRSLWRIFDVNVEGISLITSYQKTFGDEINRFGLTETISRLQQRNEELLEKFRKGGQKSS